MTDVSSTIIVGEVHVYPRRDYIMVSDGIHQYRMAINRARDLAQALQVWIERTAKAGD